MKKNRYQIAALMMSVIIATGSLSGSVFAAETDVNLGQTSEVDVEDISTEEDTTASLYASEEEMLSTDELWFDSIDAADVNKASTRTETFEKQETAPVTALNSLPETETMDVYCGWDCSLSYISEAEVPVVFDFEGVPLSYCGDRKEVYDYETDEYSFFFSIFEPGTYSINAVNTNTGDVLKKYVINVQPDRDDRTICVGSYDWLDIVSINDLTFDKMDTMDIQLRNITYEDYEVDQNSYNVVSRMFLKYSVKGIEKGDYSIRFYVNDKDHPYYIATYHVVDHYYQESKIIREATCTESGSIEKKCEICGKTVTEEIPATGHIWNEDYTIDKEATCTDEGTESIHCLACGEINEETVRAIPKKEHAYGDWTVIKEATCTEEGSKEKVCADCNDKVKEAIVATGHKWETDYTVDKEATCKEDGVESIHCAICDEIQEGSERTIPKTSHHYGEWSIAKEATCTEAGSREKVCTVCGDKVTETIAAKGHQWESDYTVDKEPTESEEGSESIHCAICNAVKEGSQRPVSFAKNVSKLDISDPVNKTYNGKDQTQSLVVKDGNLVLKQGTDYTLTYDNNRDAGDATVIITGGGKYTGSVEKTFKIARAKQQIKAKATATLEVGKTTKVALSGAKETPTYNYRSSNNTVATVSSNGTVTGKGVGTVTITVSFSETKNYEAGSTTVKISVNKVLKKPGNCHFTKWNNSKYTGCRISWNKVDGAEGYQTLLSWTDGSHSSATIVKSNVLYRDCTVHPQHVSQMKVRAFYTLNGQRKYGPWSNVEYITPSPAKLTTKNASSGSNLKMNISWNIIYGCNGYNVFITTNPNGKWYWNQSTTEKATATSASIDKCGGAKLKKNTRYYVRIVTRRKRNGVFCTVPMPANNTYIGSFVIN